MDDEGMDITHLKDELKKLVKAGKKPRFIYTVPDYQNPTGITLSLARRKELIKIAQDNEIPLIEDSPYRELSFTGEVLPSIWTLSEGKGTLMLKTFSKTLFPGMRMGWIVAETVLIDKTNPPQGRCSRYFMVDLKNHPEAKRLQKGQIVNIAM